MSSAVSATPTTTSASVESRSFSWRPKRGVRKTALFRLSSWGALLQHIRTVTVQQLGASGAEIDTSPRLDDVPDWAIAELRAEGYELAAGGARAQ